MTRTSESAAAQSTERHTLRLALRSRVCAALCFGCAWLAISASQSACASSETLTKGPYDPGAGGSNPGGNGGAAGAGSATVGGTAGDSGAAGDPNGGASGAAQGGASQGGASHGGANQGGSGGASQGGASQGGSAQGGASQAGSGGSTGGSAGSGNAGSGSGGSTANGGSAGSGGCASVNATSAANSCNGQALPSGYNCWNVSGVNGATGNDSNPACGGGGLAGQDLVFSFVAPQSGQVHLSMTGPFEKAIYVMLGSCTNQPIQCVRRTDFAAASTSFTATSGDTFYVFVDSTSDGEWGAFDLSITY